MSTLASFPLRLDWENTLPAHPPEPWPVPEVGARATEDLHGKAAVTALVALAQSMGWTVLVTEAKGSWPGVGQRPSRARWSLAARLSAGGRRGVAVYIEGPSEGASWAWDALYHWSAAQPRIHAAATITDFTNALLGTPHAPSLADAGLGPMLGPKRMPPGFLKKLGPIHGPDLPPRIP